MSDRSTNRAYLSLGSNIEPEQNLPAAVRALTSFGRIVAVSNVWESAPFGSHGANFLNAAVLLETELSATEIYQQAIVEVERLKGLFDVSLAVLERSCEVGLALREPPCVEVRGPMGTPPVLTSPQ